jgi:precorrin-4 methylase
MAEESQEKQYSTEELVAIANDALMKNRQLQGMVNDLADKVKAREIENSSLRTTLGMIQNQTTGGENAEASTEEE